jgi:hypothetical protein
LNEAPQIQSTLMINNKNNEENYVLEEIKDKNDSGIFKP